MATIKTSTETLKEKKKIFHIVLSNKSEFIFEIHIGPRKIDDVVTTLVCKPRTQYSGVAWLLYSTMAPFSNAFTATK